MILSEWAQAHYDSVKEDPEYMAVKLRIDIDDRLYFRVEELEITQKELAKRIGKSQSFVSRILNHENNMTLETLVAMADALDLVVNIRLIPKQEEQK